MYRSSKLAFYILTVFMAGSITTVNAAGCGSAPIKPELLKGKTATMEALIENSKEVKTFVANVDTYLDCLEAEMVTEAFQTQDEKIKKAADKTLKSLLKQRNGIGDAFNKQVRAFKKANPSS